MNRKGFKVVCIIIIIFGALAVFGSVSFFSSSILGGIAALASAIVEIVAGVIGLKALKDSDKIKAANIISYVYLVFVVVVQIINIISSMGQQVAGGIGIPASSMAIMSAIIALILPILYILGAKKL